VVVAPPKALTYLLVLVGILSSIAADAGYLVLIPLAAAAFISVGRHPLAGLAAAFAAVAAAFLVNILIVPVDGILTEITNDAIHLVNPTISIDLAANIWFSIASVVMLTIVIALITEKMVEPRLGEYRGDYALQGDSGLSVDEYRGLRFALFGLLGTVAFIALLTLPPGGAAAQPRDRRDHRQLAVHEQPDRVDRPAVPDLRHRLRHRRPDHDRHARCHQRDEQGDREPQASTRSGC
jgi:aminobenzoyl-glutamate transport protein